MPLLSLFPSSTQVSPQFSLHRDMLSRYLCNKHRLTLTLSFSLSLTLITVQEPPNWCPRPTLGPPQPILYAAIKVHLQGVGDGYLGNSQPPTAYDKV